MNKERLSELADVLQGIHEHEVKGEYNQNKYTHPCGSPSCIAGWAVYLFEPHNMKTEPFFLGSYRVNATRILGLTKEQSYWLFKPVYSSYKHPGTAAEMLRHFIKTGEVDWKQAEKIYYLKSRNAEKSKDLSQYQSKERELVNE